MAQLEITSQNARKYTVIGLLLLTGIAAVLAIAIGLQLDKQLAGEDVSALSLCTNVTGLTDTCPANSTEGYNYCANDSSIAICKSIKCRDANNTVYDKKQITTTLCPGGFSCESSGNIGSCVSDVTSSTTSSAQSSTTTSFVAGTLCSGDNRDNGCSCNGNLQCASGFCDPSTNTCRRDDNCQGENRPNGCLCGTNNDNVCASGNCSPEDGGAFYRCRPVAGCDVNPKALGCRCDGNDKCSSGLCNIAMRTCVSGSSAGGGGGTGTGGLPSTGLFDEDGRPLLIGLILLSLGLITYISTRKSNNTLVSSTGGVSHHSSEDIDPDIARIINSQRKKK